MVLREGNRENRDMERERQWRYFRDKEINLHICSMFFRVKGKISYERKYLGREMGRERKGNEGIITMFYLVGKVKFITI